MAKKDKFEQELRSFIKSTLRRASLRWKPRSEALKLARKERGLYQCAMCENLVKNGNYILDHINPVVPITGSNITIEQWIRGLLVKAEEFQLLCKVCSDAKTAVEDKMRATMNQKRKELDKLNEKK